MVDRINDGNSSDRPSSGRPARAAKPPRSNPPAPRPRGPRRLGDLQVEEDESLRRKAATAHRVGWGVMAAFLALAMLGLFGSGPISRARAGGRGAPLRLEYERFGRHHTQTMIRAHLGPGAVARGEARVWLDLDYVEGIQLRRITPEPERVEAGPDRLTYVFPVARADRPTTVTFHFEPERVGPLAGRIGLATGEGLGFGQFVYP